MNSFFGNNGQQSIFGGNNNFGGNSGFGNSNFGQMNNDRQLITWFLKVLNEQVFNLVANNTIPNNMVNQIMIVGQQNAVNYVKYIMQECNNDLTNASDDILLRCFSAIIQNIGELIAQAQNEQRSAMTNTITNMANGGFGNNNFGNTSPSIFGGGNFGGNGGFNNPINVFNEPLRPKNNQLNTNFGAFGNNVPQNNYSAPPVDELMMMSIPEKYRPANWNKSNTQSQPQPQQSVESIRDSFNREVSNHNTVAPVVSTPRVAKCDRRLSDLTKIKSVKNGTFLEVEDDPYETSKNSTPVAFINTILKKTEIVENIPQIRDTLSLANDGVMMPVKSATVSTISKEVVLERSNTPTAQTTSYNERKVEDGRVVDKSGDNYNDCSTQSANIIQLTNSSGSSHVIHADIEDQDVITSTEDIIAKFRDGSLLDAFLLDANDNSRPFIDVDTNTNMAISVQYKTMETLNIPYDVMEVVYNKIQNLCHSNTVNTFNKFYNSITEILYDDMKRRFSEELDSWMTKHINNVLAVNTSNFTDGIAGSIAIENWISIYELLSNNKLTGLKSDHCESIKKLIYHVVCDLFCNKIFNPSDQYDLETILDSDVCESMVVRYHKGAISSTEYASWNKESDRDLINKLNVNIRKFTALSVNNKLFVTTLKPVNAPVLMTWLFGYGDRSIDPLTMFISKQLYDHPTTRDMIIIDPNTGLDMVNPKGEAIIGKSLDEYYGYMLTA